MNVRLIIAVVFGALGTAQPAQAQMTISAAGGVNAAVGRLGDLTDLGYNVAAGLNFGGTSKPITTRLEGALNSFGYKSGGGDIRIITGTANAIFNVGRTSDSPYLIGGLGAYNRRISGSTVSFDSGKTAVGINAGGGLRFPLSGISTFFEARYHMMLGNAADATNYHFIPITFGIVF